MRREIGEEIGIDIEILNQADLPLDGNVKKNLATPFYVNVHVVGDHDHCALFYICRAVNPDELKINREQTNWRWFKKDELNKDYVPADVKNQALKAFELYNERL
ncbi:MAG: hypothetical protein NUV82_02180 [Candidatus Komeilibacteria bacterium]|nr:hypothetical protein [Candidatus Komeilibacteria bacterium]